MEILHGYCECGCGNPAPLARQNDKRKGYVKNQPTRFISGHNCRLRKGPSNPLWKGGGTKKGGYVIVLSPGHPNADERGRVSRARLAAEKALGEFLPIYAVVHHFDENKGNDDNKNLVICENDNYHRILHQRNRAYKACGYASWRKCTICKEYDEPKNLYINNASPVHYECARLRQKQYRTMKKEL